MLGFAPDITCCHCGRKDEEHTEYPRGLNRDGDTAIGECWYCGEPFKVTMCVTYEYATQPIHEEKNDAR